MRLYTRIIFGLNCLYQAVVGIVFLSAPVLSIGLYGFAALDSQSMAAHVGVRVMGAFMLVAAAMSALIAFDPDKHPVLLPLMALVSSLTLVCWGITLFTREMTFSQVGLDIVVQILLLIGAVGYASKAGEAFKGAHAIHA